MTGPERIAADLQRRREKQAKRQKEREPLPVLSINRKVTT